MTADRRNLSEVSSKVYPSLERVPGKQNWVDKAGGLPSYIERIAKHLHYEGGRPIGSAIAMAVSTVKKWCATGRNHNGSNVKADTQAKACAAVASWEKKKAKSKLKESVEMREALALLESQAPEMTDEEVATLATQVRTRLLLAEGMLPALRERSCHGKGELVDRARELVEADLSTSVTLAMIGGRHASPYEQRQVREALEVEVADLRALAEALGVEEACAKADMPSEGKDEDISSVSAYERAKRRKKKKKMQEGETAFDEGKHPRVEKGKFGGQFATVGKGDSGNLVTGAQSALGMDDPSGNFDKDTEQAVRDFQEENGLQVDGVIGSQTAAAMQGREAEVGELSKNDKRWLRRQGRELTETLKRGSEGKMVKRLQEGLIEAGIFVGDAGADGKFDTETEKGVKALQRRRRQEPTGEADPAFRATLSTPEWGDLAEAGVGRLRKLRSIDLPDLDSVGRGRVNAEIKRLPDGTFAPKGMGQVLYAGDDVHIGGVAGKVEADGKRIKLADGKQLNLAKSAQAPEVKKPLEKPTVDKPNKPDTQAADISDKLEKDNAQFQTALDRYNAEQENPDAQVPPIAGMPGTGGMRSPAFDEGERDFLKRHFGLDTIGADLPESPADLTPERRTEWAASLERGLRNNNLARGMADRPAATSALTKLISGKGMRSPEWTPAEQDAIDKASEGEYGEALQRVLSGDYEPMDIPDALWGVQQVADKDTYSSIQKKIADIGNADATGDTGIAPGALSGKGMHSPAWDAVDDSEASNYADLKDKDTWRDMAADDINRADATPEEIEKRAEELFDNWEPSDDEIYRAQGMLSPDLGSEWAKERKKAIDRRVSKGFNRKESEQMFDELAAAHSGDNLAHALEYQGFGTEAGSKKIAAALPEGMASPMHGSFSEPRSGEALEKAKASQQAFEKRAADAVAAGHAPVKVSARQLEDIRELKRMQPPETAADAENLRKFMAQAIPGFDPARDPSTYVGLSNGQQFPLFRNEAEDERFRELVEKAEALRPGQGIKDFSDWLGGWNDHFDSLDGMNSPSTTGGFLEGKIKETTDELESLGKGDEDKIAPLVNKLQTLVLKKDIHATKTELETLYPSGYGADKSITAENADWPKIRSLEGKLADQIDSLDVAQKDGMYSREIDPDAHADDADWLADRDREKREAVEQAMAKQVKPLRDAGIGEGMTDAELLDTLPQQEVKGGFGTAVLDRYTKTGDPYPNRSRFKAPGEDEIDSPQIRNYEPEVTREELEALPEGGSITVESGDWNPYHKPHWTTDHTVITKRGDKFDLGEPPDEWVHGDEYDREYIEAENWPPYPFRTGYTYDEVVDWLGPDAVGGRTEQEAHEAEMAETLKRTQRVLNQRSRTLKNFPEAHRIPEVEEVIMGTVDLTDSSERDRVRRAIEREKVKAWDAYQRRRSELEEYNRQFSDMRHSTDFGTRAEYREWTRAAQAADRARSQAGDDWATVQAALDHVTSQGEGMRSPSTPWMDEAGLKAQLDDPDMAIGEGIEPISEGIAGRSAVLQYGSDRFIVTGEPEKVSAAVDRLTTGYGDVGPEDVEIRRLDGNPGSLAAQRLDSVHTVTNTDEFGNIFRRPLTPDDYAGMADGMIVDGKQIVIPPSSNGMASPATVREYETIGKMIDGETVDLPNGVSAKTGEVTFDGLTAPVVNPDLPRSPGGDARQTARVAHALDSFKGLTAEDVEPNSAEAIWQDFVEGREEGVQGLAELAATDPGMLWAGMASPPITPNPEPLPDHYQPNSTALELDQLPIGTYFTDAAGYPYVLHKALPKKDGSVEYMIAKPVDSAGQIIDNDPHPHAVKGVGSKAHGPTRRILFHRWPPANVGAVHPDYAEDVDITVDGPPPVAVEAEKAIEAGQDAVSAVSQATELVDYGKEAWAKGSPLWTQKGNMRQIKQMKTGKFLSLWQQMQQFESVDSKGYEAVNAEYGRRQGLPSSDPKSLNYGNPGLEYKQDHPGQYSETDSNAVPKVPEEPVAIMPTTDQSKAPTAKIEHWPTMKQGPGRGPAGKPRNVKAMGDIKLWGLASDLTAKVLYPPEVRDNGGTWGAIDPEVFGKVHDELVGRGQESVAADMRQKLKERSGIDWPVLGVKEPSKPTVDAPDLTPDAPDASVEPSLPPATASPVRSAKGNIRQVKQMNDDKLYDVALQMGEPAGSGSSASWADVDPEGWNRVKQALNERGMDVPSPGSATGTGSTPHEAATAAQKAAAAQSAPSAAPSAGQGEGSLYDAIQKSVEGPDVDETPSAVPSDSPDYDEAKQQELEKPTVDEPTPTARVASTLGSDWTSTDVQSALDDLANKGVNLDIEAEAPETVAAVIKATGATPHGAGMASPAHPLNTGNYTPEQIEFGKEQAVKEWKLKHAGMFGPELAGVEADDDEGRDWLDRNPDKVPHGFNNDPDNPDEPWNTKPIEVGQTVRLVNARPEHKDKRGKVVTPVDDEGFAGVRWDHDGTNQVTSYPFDEITPVEEEGMASPGTPQRLLSFKEGDKFHMPEQGLEGVVTTTPDPETGFGGRAKITYAQGEPKDLDVTIGPFTEAGVIGGNTNVVAGALPDSTSAPEGMNSPGEYMAPLDSKPSDILDQGELATLVKAAGEQGLPAADYLEDDEMPAGHRLDHMADVISRTGDPDAHQAAQKLKNWDQTYWDPDNMSRAELLKALGMEDSDLPDYELADMLRNRREGGS